MGERGKVYLIAGLGNPGPRYRNTRHNIGFKAINLWCKSQRVRLNGRRFQSKTTRTKFHDNDVILVQPSTFMNQSGKPIKASADFWNIDTKNILVIHDDIDLPAGRIKLIRNGGAGGHKGVLSIINHLGTNDFPRVKIGIDRPRYMEPIDEYVLSPFYEDEKETVEKVIQMAVKACVLFISEGIESAMNYTNCQHLANKEEIN